MGDLSKFLLLAALSLSLPHSAWGTEDGDCADALSLLVPLPIAEGAHQWVKIVKPGEGDNPDHYTIGGLSLHKANMGQIFRHQYNFSKRPSDYGAKSIVFKDDHGFTHVLIFQTGVVNRDHNIHHRDAVADMLRRVAIQYEQQAEVLLDRDTLTRDQEIRAEKYLEAVERYRKWADTINADRKQESYPPELLSRLQGFQMTARVENRGGVKTMKVMRLEVDSSITATQNSRGLVPEAEVQAEFIRTMHESISPEVRGYGSRIHILGLERASSEYRAALEDILHPELNPQTQEDH